jgi:hypothetical protein
MHDLSETEIRAQLNRDFNMYEHVVTICTLRPLDVRPMLYAFPSPFLCIKYANYLSDRIDSTETKGNECLPLIKSAFRESFCIIHCSKKI